MGKGLSERIEGVTRRLKGIDLGGKGVVLKIAFPKCVFRSIHQQKLLLKNTSPQLHRNSAAARHKKKQTTFIMNSKFAQTIHGVLRIFS